MNEANQIPISRRKFFNKLSIFLITLSSIFVGLPFIGFLFIPLFRRVNRTWRSVGDVSQFKVGTTVRVEYEDPTPLPWAGVTAKTAAWLRRDSELVFIAFSIDCTHLGCPVRWLPEANLFMCPCHGG
ncbi:MAG: Rieske 2Fe-2S domain-containing protein, partial [Calditrichia bacterium]